MRIMLVAKCRISIPLWCDWDQVSGHLNIEAHGNFNSIMVRLGQKTAIHVFEFIQISIPLWCDWDRDESIESLCGDRISIPLWCDWDKTSSHVHPSQYRISIPLWCDWDKRSRNGITFYQNFNSIMVRLGPINKCEKYKIKIENFNSIMVRLGQDLVISLTLILLDFNSIMVRLGLLAGRGILVDFRHFNSIMVRLGQISQKTVVI